MTNIYRPRCALLFFLTVALAGGGCARLSTPGIAEMTRHTVVHDGLDRELFVFLPSAYDASRQLPVVIFLHGYGGSATGTEAEVTNGITRYAEEFGYVMVFPQSTWFMSDGTREERWEVTSWNHISDGFDKGPEGLICRPDADVFPCPPECGSCGQCGWASCNDDVGFLRKLVALLVTEFAVDDERFYIAGFSNGAMMAQRMGCEAPGLFAAVGLVGGRVEPGFECTPGESLPLLQINGGDDDVAPFDGRVSESGYFYASTVSTAAYWNFGSACANPTGNWTSPTIENEHVSCTIACGGSDRESIDCVWPDGNHRWPGTAGFRGSNGYCVTELQAVSMPEQSLCREPDLEKEIWGSRLLFEFFNSHRGEQQ